MSKVLRNSLLTIVLCLLTFFMLVSCGDKTEETQKITVTFSGTTTVLEIEEDGSITAPTVTLGAGQELLGWALDASATKAKYVSTIKFASISTYAKDGKVTLYPVIENTVSVTLKGITEVTTKVSDITLNTATLPLVEQNERQKFVGWTLTQGSTEVAISSDGVINYTNVKDLATNATLTMYPVVETYDLMICIHGSHSNGNIYVSEEQFAEIEKAFAEAFPGKNILIDRIDGVSATNFAAQAVTKDYDLILGSKTVSTKSATETGDIYGAAQKIGKNYDIEDSDYVEITLVDLNQSRRVGKVLGSENEKPLQEAAYQLFLTPMDKVVEVTFKNGDITETVDVHRVVGGVLNTAYTEPENTAIKTGESGKIFYGWTTVENGVEVELASISYSQIYAKAVDGKLTVYPVFSNTPDFYAVIWGVNGSTTYILEEEYNAIVAGYNQYLADNSISIVGKTIVLDYFVGKTAEFQTELTKEYVNAAIGASALGGESYQTYWTVSDTHFAKVVNATTTNTSRYVGLRSGSETNELAVAFYRYLTEATVTVEFDGAEGSQVVSSYTGNLAVEPEVTAPAGYTFIGWSTTKDDTTAMVAKESVKYTTVKSLATEGAVKLYPVFVDTESLITYELVIYVLRGNSSSEYITVEEAENAVSTFKTWLVEVKGDNTEYDIKLDATQRGAGADFLLYVDGRADIVIGASNLNPTCYDGTVGHKVINSVFTTSTSRYAYITSDCTTHKDLADLFIEFMCDEQVEVTIGEAKTILSLVQDNSLTLTHTPADGYQFNGWTNDTETNAIVILPTVESVKYADVKSLATDGKVTLTPVDSLIQAGHTCAHVCPHCGKCTDMSCADPTCAEKCAGCTLNVVYHSYGAKTSTAYFTDAMVEKAKTALNNKLAAEGIDANDVTITWTAVHGKVLATTQEILKSSYDVTICHAQCYTADNTENNPVVAAALYPATAVSTVFGTDTKCKVAVVNGSEWNRLAQWLYDIVVNYTEA